jgi:hypothetical protein
MENVSSLRERTFLQAFLGSFLNVKDYPLFVERSLGSAIAHFVLLVTLVCSIYSGLTAYWVKAHVDPYVRQAIAQVPTINVKNGIASSSITQPHVIAIENQPVFVLDTTQDPTVHLEKYPAICVLSADRLTTKDSRGKIESYKLEGSFELSPGILNNGVEVVASWMLPLLFILCALWQLSWKSLQVLLVAGIVTLVNSSRPGFSVHLRLACYALSPAMVWGLAVYGAWLTGVYVPFASLIFWCILFGVTAGVAAQIRNSPKYH